VGASSAAIRDFLLDEVRRMKGPENRLIALYEYLDRSVVPLARAACMVPTLHPLVRAMAYRWARGVEPMEILRAPWGAEHEPAFRASPLHLLLTERVRVRRRLEGADPVLDFPILHELRAAGATDYYAMPTELANGDPLFLTWSTDRPGGFTDGDLERLDDLAPILGLLIEVPVARDATRSVLDTYVGTVAAGRIMAGEIRRGQGETVRAILWFSDLRGFTAMAESLDGQELIATLDTYFETMVRAVHQHGGEVLKFIGDGLLAIFRGPEADGARAAITAARTATAAVTDLTVGITLHAGEVVYGNIGAPDRLDFTAIGPAVNAVNRLQSLCAPDRHSILASAAVIHAAGATAEPLGHHRLRGVTEPVEVFRL
jgi:adenylate cyclase